MTQNERDLGLDYKAGFFHAAMFLYQKRLEKTVFMLVEARVLRINAQTCSLCNTRYISAWELILD